MTARISIAMCTFNGARHLDEQLRSFVDQTRPPDELVICDDGSTDDTPGIAEQFAATAPFDVHVRRNLSRLGFAGNFEQAARLVTGDIVLFSDQDDVWRPTKVRKITEAIETNPEVGLAFCDADLVDEDLRHLGTSYWERQRFGRAAQARLAGPHGARLLLKNPAWMAAGATMAYAARFNPLIFPFPPGWTHDAWIATVVASQARVAVVPECLNAYRQHRAQVYGASASAATHGQLARQRGGSADHFLATADRYRALAARLGGADAADRRLLPQVEGKIRHWQARARMRDSSRPGRVPAVLQEAASGRYGAYSQGVRSIAMDLLL